MGTRCFVALPLPAEYQQALPKIVAEWKPRLRSRLSWTKEGNWHLTLKFLGELEPGILDQVHKALRTVTAPQFEVQASGGGFFPPGRNPKVVWVGLSRGADSCTRLAADIDQALQPLGLPPDTRPFRPHLTIARIKKSEPDDWPQLLSWLHAWTWPSFRAQRFVLYASRLTPQGPVYSELESCPLDETQP